MYKRDHIAIAKAIAVAGDHADLTSSQLSDVAVIVAGACEERQTSGTFDRDLFLAYALSPARKPTAG